MRPSTQKLIARIDEHLRQLAAPEVLAILDHWAESDAGLGWRCFHMITEGREWFVCELEDSNGVRRAHQGVTFSEARAAAACDLVARDPSLTEGAA